MKSYCYFCDKDVEYIVKEEEVHEKLKGVEISYIAKIPYCSECRREIYVAELDDDNIRKAHEKYRKKLNEEVNHIIGFS
ncbi:hypothetical protein SAMN02746089_02570 [Caldanaerobius fijiensis DSM 17918]|uniref:YgiT-type zinc finger domain-containing protein n=1 Tax=Caldanaerobius fijiensis DSM 17918 TaxID=1121256 RepID=A0A1M5ELF6_9THEO|nr:hypothetical protein [Caldanaerobius fijiensis]SHF79911.1 hypothetical protein SAMN02746089_02570 [Caldanaerobius fijiensis DSM 17918]